MCAHVCVVCVCVMDMDMDMDMVNGVRCVYFTLYISERGTHVIHVILRHERMPD